MPLPLFADENVSLSLVDALDRAGYDTVRIGGNDLSADDPDVLDIATQSGRALLTFDSDFGTMAFRDGIAATFGIVYCRLHLLGTHKAADRIAEILSEIDDLSNRIVVIEEKRYRLRDLPVRSIGEFFHDRNNP